MMRKEEKRGRREKRKTGRFGRGEKGWLQAIVGLVRKVRHLNGKSGWMKGKTREPDRLNGL